MATDAPNGTAPSPASGATVMATFAAGVWTSSAALLTFYRAGESPTIAVTDAASGVSGTSAAILVSPAALDRLALSPETATIALGQSQAYTAEGLDAYDNPRGDVTGEEEGGA